MKKRYLQSLGFAARRRRSGTIDWMRLIYELGPDSPPICGPEFAPGDGPSGEPFDLNASLDRDRPRAVLPLSNGLGTDAQRFGELCPPSNQFAHRIHAHGLEGKALLYFSQEALPARRPGEQTQAMLPEQKELGEKIRAAIDLLGWSNRQVAKRFGVTPQAVGGWTKSGRIKKNRLLELIRVTGPLLPPGFWGQDFEGHSSGTVLFPQLKNKTRPHWPFSTAEELVCDLPAAILEGVDAQLAYLVGKHLKIERRSRARPKSSG